MGWPFLHYDQGKVDYRLNKPDNNNQATAGEGGGYTLVTHWYTLDGTTVAIKSR